jgi:prepilin peptidase CpaA
MPEDLTPLLFLAPVLCATIVSDMRRMRIPNSYSLLAVLFFAIYALIVGPSDLIGRIAASGGVFALGFLGFGLRLVGGGDVKFLAALVLYVPCWSLLLFANALSICLLTGVAIILILRRIPVASAGGWTGVWGSDRFPMGLSIGLAGLVHPWLAMAFAAV